MDATEAASNQNHDILMHSQYYHATYVIINVEYFSACVCFKRNIGEIQKVRFVKFSTDLIARFGVILF